MDPPTLNPPLRVGFFSKRQILLGELDPLRTGSCECWILLRAPDPPQSSRSPGAPPPSPSARHDVPLPKREKKRKFYSCYFFNERKTKTKANLHFRRPGGPGPPCPFPAAGGAAPGAGGRSWVLPLAQTRPTRRTPPAPSTPDVADFCKWSFTVYI